MAASMQGVATLRGHQARRPASSGKRCRSTCGAPAAGGAVLGVSDARAAAIAAEYPPAAYPSADLAFSTLVSDANFACPALQLDGWTASRVPTYAYQFNDDHAPVNVAPPGALPPVATHGTGPPYLFDQPNAPFPATLTADQQILAASMRAAWASFAATGDPS